MVPTDDSFSSPDAPRLVSGAVSKLAAEPGPGKVAYLRFVVAGLPAGATVTGASLHLTRLGGHMIPPSVAYRTSTTAWSESTLTAANAPGLGATMGTTTTANGGITADVDVKAAVLGNGAVSIALRARDAGTVLRVESSESATPTSVPFLSVTWTPGVVSTGTLFGSSLNDSADVARLSSSTMFRHPVYVGRVFFPGAPPARWSDSAELRSLAPGSAAVVSWKSGSPAQVQAFLASKPGGMKVWASWYHEPEDNFTTAASMASYRSTWATYGPAIRAGGAIPTLILMRYSLNRSSGRDWRNYYPAGSVDSISWDAYNPGAKKTPGTYIDPADLIAPIVSVSSQTGLPWGLAEAGSPIVGSSAARAAWVVKLAAALRSNGAKFATWWDVNAGTFPNALDSAAAGAWH
ncbi:MAG: DNRLRE domain-containing protein [Lapillicoccus sp.]